MNQDNAGGKFDQIAGKIKQGVGEAVGNEKLANEGAAEQVKGHAKEAWGNVKDAASDTHDSTSADAHVRAEEAKLHAEQAGHDTRNSITSAAEHLKDSINRGIDHLKGDDRR
ncbi:CsbD family protein [Granulicella arctica]|uniref:CsbD family protein n=1 Tax=Granulicella arctica TaxID=940613 RepID=UPI0021DFAC5A|nr:CsbD family protein [Granulicella arctica]